jgi:anti-anti-sigma factor
MSTLDTSIKESGDITIIELSGKLDVMTSPEFDEKSEGWFAPDRKKLIIDMSALSYISSAGLRSFLRTAQEAKSLGARIVFASPCDVVNEVLSVSGFHDLIEVKQTIDEAKKVV